MAHDGPKRDYQLPHVAPSENEGKTVAGWAMFWAICLGGLVTGLGVVLWEMWVVIVGIAVIVLGLVVSKVMSAMGMGQERHRDHPPGAGQPDWYA
ncbi:MAG TPA: HGxxPAAW family protein [Actinomycetaceae bacterium]|nr:HGxxPAAW family protein [Actinomycetaceae bacterium]